MSSTTPRKTLKRVSSADTTQRRKLVGTGGLIHGTIGCQAADGSIVAPGAGVIPRGRVLVANCVSAVAGEYCDLEEGLFCWNAHGALTIADVGKKAYAFDNDSVSVTDTDGELMGIIHDVDSDGVWVLSGLGVDPGA